MNEYRGKHASSVPWAVSATASSHYRSRHMRRNRRRKKLWILAVILIAVLCSLPFLETLFPRVDRQSKPSDNLPSDIGRLRIVFLSDLHYGFHFSDGRVSSVVSTINGLKPDIILFGGDMGDTPEDAAAFYQRLPSLHARYAMLGVLGETDRGEDNLTLEMVTDAMRNAGVIPLVNEVAPVRIGTSMIYVAGLDDVLTGKPALASLASRTSVEDYVIFLCHNPSVIPESHQSEDRNGRLGWFDLALFGHTHGGQIMGLSSLLNIGGDVEDRYQRGWLVENRADLLISNGIGTSVLPARFLCPPQIHCIDVSLP